jgi:hypothetical protein
MGIIRTVVHPTKKYKARGDMNLFETQCEVSGEAVTRWQGMRGTYIKINNVVTSIILQHS